MIRKLSLILTLLPLLGTDTTALLSQDPLKVTEETKTRPSKQEIIELMLQIKQIPIAEQERRLNGVLNDSSGQNTRSRFLLCTAMAYLGNGKAQICTGNAYEHGLGIVEDLSEAYAWYTIAAENAVADQDLVRAAETAKNRVKAKLTSVYPAPSDEELDDIVRDQKLRIVQYQEEANK